MKQNKSIPLSLKQKISHSKSNKSLVLSRLNSTKLDSYDKSDGHLFLNSVNQNPWEIFLFIQPMKLTNLARIPNNRQHNR